MQFPLPLTILLSFSSLVLAVPTNTQKRACNPSNANTISVYLGILSDSSVTNAGPGGHCRLKTSIDGGKSEHQDTDEISLCGMNTGSGSKTVSNSKLGTYTVELTNTYKNPCSNNGDGCLPKLTYNGVSYDMWTKGSGCVMGNDGYKGEDGFWWR
ncbi:MAG: hypothetical protein M1812_004896 [Candelaria pacifica]|nr:MAG: hypothetical protein M1812_004896 [Candelaria pacifica]